MSQKPLEVDTWVFGQVSKWLAPYDLLVSLLSEPWSQRV